MVVPEAPRLWDRGVGFQDGPSISRGAFDVFREGPPHRNSKAGGPTFRPLSRRFSARRPIVNSERSEMQTSLSAQFAPSTV
jgi:hypothetical protein